MLDHFDGVEVVKGNSFADHRGELKKTIIGDIMLSVSEILNVTSSKNVLRGMHFQEPPNAVSKLVQCTQGEILDVILDLRKSSETYLKTGSIQLTEKDDISLFIPEGFAHGYLVLSDTAKVIYLQSGKYDSESDFSINPESINFKWPIKNFLISEKDKNAVSLSNYSTKFE